MSETFLKSYKGFDLYQDENRVMFISQSDPSDWNTTPGGEGEGEAKREIDARWDQKDQGVAA